MRSVNPRQQVPAIFRVLNVMQRRGGSMPTREINDGVLWQLQHKGYITISRQQARITEAGIEANAQHWASLGDAG